ncbi:MAG: dephospho-CoA kinase [Cyanobacteria bacterium]|nr:dephospho-CoA kinase [Cyanobacteriota bacterium]MDA1021112.1 dephospho-CoA kinase [Cyanobacteriota bacterium]
MPKIIGLTGNIACGKSSLARILIERGIPVLDSDDVVQELYQDKQVQSEILEIFASLDKQKISKMIFGDDDLAKSRRKELEAILHPRIKHKFNEWLQQNQSAELVVNVLPLLFEAGLENRYDYIVTVFCDDKVQLHRLQARNPELSGPEIEKRIKSQMPQTEKIKRADYLIENNQGLEELKQGLNGVLEQIRLVRN